MRFFGEIYCLAEDFFGRDLAEHLWGWDGAAGDYVKANLFNVFGPIAVVTALLFFALYYYVVNHPRFNRWWSWLIVLGVVGVINLFIGFYITNRDRELGNISPDFIVNVENCWLFGLVNFIVSISFFILFSFGLKWWSSNCKHSPIL